MQRALNWKQVWSSFEETIRTTCMLFTIVFSAVVLTYFVVLTHLPNALVEWTKGFHIGPIELMVMMVIFYIILGCFMEAFGMMLITVPVFLPLVVQSGFDPVWFGVMLV